MQNQAIFTALNNTFSGNSAAGNGGVLSNANQPVFDALHVTITGNSAGGQGGAINQDNSPVQDDPPVAFQSSIVAGNTAAGAPNDCVVNDDFDDPVVSRGNNLGGVGECSFTAPGDQQGADPQLGPLAANGGPTQTHALAEGSPAIDAGAAGACPATDQRGVGRPQRSGCDIGAYELEPSAGGPTAQAPAPAPGAPVAGRPARPRVRVAGVRRACVGSSMRISVVATTASGVRVRRVTISVDGRRVKSATRRRFATRIMTGRLRPGRHRLRISVTDTAGNSRATTRSFTRCARRAQRRALPRFTG
jgi:hypothetical protein